MHFILCFLFNLELVGYVCGEKMRIMKHNFIGFFLIFIVIMAFSFGAFVKFSVAEDKKMASDFAEKNALYIINMDYENIKPLMATDYLGEFNSDENQKVIRKYLSLGKIKSYDNPVYYGSDTTAGKYSKNQRTLYFLMLVHFESADAEIKISLLKSEDSFLINQLKITFS